MSEQDKATKPADPSMVASHEKSKADDKPKDKSKDKPKDEPSYLQLDEKITDPDTRERYANHVTGVQKRERQLDEREKSLSDNEADAKFYRDNKSDIDELMQLKDALNDPAQSVKTAEALLERVKGTRYTPEHDSEKDLQNDFNATIAAVEQRLGARISKHDEDFESRSESAKLEQRAKDSYADTAAEVARECGGYKLAEDDHSAAVKARPLLSEAEAVYLHCRAEINKHQASSSAHGTPKKDEIVDDAGRKSPDIKPTKDMSKAYAQRQELVQE